MTSPRFRVEISATVRDFLARRAETNRAEAREVALLLLRLERAPKPTGSRPLRPRLVEPIPGERIWERADWTITYRVLRRENLIVVGKVEPSATRSW